MIFFSGNGYLTACFALMVGSEGRAVGVEHIPELVATSIENIKKSAAAPQLNDGSLSIHIAGKYRTQPYVEAASIQPIQCRDFGVYITT
jgi:protein-L-isoaspartate O-methyltransferase